MNLPVSELFIVGFPTFHSRISWDERRRSIVASHWRVQFPFTPSRLIGPWGLELYYPDIPSGYVKIAIENGDLVRGFSH